MCGIIAFLRGRDSNQNSWKIIYDGISMLQNRGYDSIGCHAIVDQTRFMWKMASTVDKMAIEPFQEVCEHTSELFGNIMAHTRWATHGPKTDENAHPHCDNSGKIWIVHNGILENYQDLRDICVKYGDIFHSQTDTEVIAHWIGHNWNKEDPLLGLCVAEQRMEGTWALIIQHLDYPNQLWVMKHGSPLCLAYLPCGSWALASEGSALSGYANDFCALNEHQIFELNNESNEILIRIMQKHYDFIDTLHGLQLSPEKHISPREGKNIIKSWKEFKKFHGQVRIIQEMNPVRSPDPFAHWMIREIMEQPDALRRAMNHGARWNPEGPGTHLGGLSKIEKTISSIQSIIFVACGTSGYAGQWAADWFRRRLGLHHVSNLDASEWDSSQWVRPDTAYCFLSQSGETKDVHRALVQLKKDSPETIIYSIVNVVDSLIARETGVGLYCNAGPERAVASTKSFLNQCVVLGIIMIWFLEHQIKPLEIWPQWAIQWRESMSHLPIVLENWLQNQKFINKIKSLSMFFKEKERVFVLGRGNTVSIAREGALKLKEVAYVHAEGFVGGALKHGPFSLIEKGTPVIILAAEHGDGEENVRKQILAAEETKSRGAVIIFITDSLLPEIKQVSDYLIETPECGDFSSLLQIIPIQLLAYYTAIGKGINPDYPRNLAKVVTVDG